MKILITFVLLALSVSFAHADTQAEKWVCYAEGKQSFGDPVGDIWQTVSGSGTTELEATDQAQQNCFMQGLDMCMVDSCSKQ